MFEQYAECAVHHLTPVHPMLVPCIASVTAAVDNPEGVLGEALSGSLR
jgi:hypothetical protein